MAFETSGYQIFLKLSQHENNSTGFVPVQSLPYSANHKIGISKDGYPMFFIKCDTSSRAIDINLEFIAVSFSQDCRIKEGELQSSKVLTVVYLKTLDRDLQQYFADVIPVILKQLNPIPSETKLFAEIQKVIELFSHTAKPPIKTIQGLFAELLVIERASNREYLLQAWHASPSDKFDFNDGKDKIEVKSTSSTTRNHRFSIDQLAQNSGSNLLIASTFVVETGVGITLFDLRDRIAPDLNNLELRLQLSEVIYRTIGYDYRKLNELFFDYQMAADSLIFFDSADVPNIPIDSIPMEVTSITFDSNLSNISAINLQEKFYKVLEDSKLFKSLGLL